MRFQIPTATDLQLSGQDLHWPHLHQTLKSTSNSLPISCIYINASDPVCGSKLFGFD